MIVVGVCILNYCMFCLINVAKVATATDINWIILFIWIWYPFDCLVFASGKYN